MTVSVAVPVVPLSLAEIVCTPGVFAVQEISGNARSGASGMIGNVQPDAPAVGTALCGFVMDCASGRLPQQAEQG